MWEIVVLDYFEVGDSTAGHFCCGRLWYWTFLLWEILLLDFLASGQMNRQALLTVQILTNNVQVLILCLFYIITTVSLRLNSKQSTMEL